MLVQLNNKYSIRNIIIYLSLFVLLPLFFQQREMIVATGSFIYDIFLLSILICRTLGKKSVLDKYFSWCCILPLLGIMGVADWKYYFCSTSDRNMLLIIAFGIAFCISALVMKFHWKGIKPIATFLLFILLTFSVFGQAMLFNDALNLSRPVEITCEITDKFDYPDRGGIVDTYTITLEPVKNATVECNNCELSYFSVNKAMYNQIDIGDIYKLNLYEGLFAMNYYDKSEVLVCIQKQINQE